ncbi:MAG: FAD-dependent oxidoreductase, partial [Pseudomonadota bacterium]
MKTQIPLTRDLLLIGGGHAHALVLRLWGMNPLPGVRVTVINPGPTAPYSGMLPGHVAGHYTRDELDIDLVRVARFASARLIDGAVDGIDLDAKTVSVPGRDPIPWDVASIDIGIHSEMPDLPGFTDHAIGAKPLDRFAREWRAYREAANAGEIAKDIAIIGGGIAGVELSMAMAHA